MLVWHCPSIHQKIILKFLLQYKASSSIRWWLIHIQHCSKECHCNISVYHKTGEPTEFLETLAREYYKQVKYMGKPNNRRPDGLYWVYLLDDSNYPKFLIYIDGSSTSEISNFGRHLHNLYEPKNLQKKHCPSLCDNHLLSLVHNPHHNWIFR